MPIKVSRSSGFIRPTSDVRPDLGRSTWAVVPQGQEGFAADSEQLKTISYGGGARWFIKTHLAFSFDVRFYAINPGTPFVAGVLGSPRKTLLVIGAGVSVR